MCGGTESTTASRHGPQGLSPRVRGNRHRPRAAAAASSSIPACAGEPAAFRLARARARVYPRVCGGTWCSRPYHRPASGLSPRVRGNPALRNVSEERIRSIPACAGEPCWSAMPNWCARVYPRVCGGTGQRHRPRLVQLGLSPRVRGNRQGGDAGRVRLGSIPACAGEPSRDSQSPSAAQVYPRVCGGTASCHTRPRCENGLSPRVRGNRWRRRCQSARPGSIPACAGEPTLAANESVPYPVYPRVCGGTSWASRQPGADWGLSPRVRGNRPNCGVVGPMTRSIPACAGEPRTGISRSRRARVYPRVCGGTSRRRCRRSWRGGLSPRVRGNHCRPRP